MLVGIKVACMVELEVTFVNVYEPVCAGNIEPPAALQRVPGVQAEVVL